MTNKLGVTTHSVYSLRYLFLRFRRFRRVLKRPLTSSSQPVCLSTCIKLPQSGRIFLKFGTGYFY